MSRIDRSERYRRQISPILQGENLVAGESLAYLIRERS